MLPLIEFIVGQGGSILHVLKMILFLLPDIVSFALPAICLTSVVLAFLRMSHNNELIALKSSGLSLYQMLPPVVLFGLLGFSAAILISLAGIPWGKQSFNALIFEMAQTKANLGIKERIFCEPFDNLHFYVHNISKRDDAMTDVFVVDKRDPGSVNTIVAKSARISLNPDDKQINLNFSDGSIFMVEQPMKSVRTIGFKSYDLAIGLKDIMAAAIAKRRKEPEELTVDQLIGQIKNEKTSSSRKNKLKISLNERFSFPVAVFFMGIIGVPLGAQMRSRGRPAGVGLSLGVFGGYYALLAGARNISAKGAIPPEIATWLPDAIIIFAGFYLLHRVANERSINFFKGIRFRI